MIGPDLLEILRCPYCAPQGREGLLELCKDVWLVCRECGRKYPIQDDIPIMMVDEGEKWIETPAEDLPLPPPRVS